MHEWALLAAVVIAGAAVAAMRRRRAASPIPLTRRLQLIYNLVRFRTRWGQHDSHLAPEARLTGTARDKVRANPKFMSAAAAAALVPNGSTVVNCGFAAAETTFPFYMAIRERFETTNEPRDLTWVCPSANGARGIAPGSMDELARKGLVKRYIAGHLETVKGMLRMGEAGSVELHNIPNLTIAELVAVQAETGALSVESPVGVGTFLDPRVGDGSRVTKNCTDQFIKANVGADVLEFSIPGLDVVVMNVKRVDVEGNAYLDRNSVITASFDGPKAVRRRGGKVLVSTQFIVPVDKTVDAALVLRASDIDAICLCDAPRMMDPIGFTSHFVPRPRKATSAEHLVLDDTWALLRFTNTFIGATPKRSATDLALGRLASQVFVDTFRGAKPTDDGRLLATIGIGLPEEVSHNIFKAGLTPGRLTLCTESGTIGGLPAMGMFFGAAVLPEKVLSEAGVYRYLAGRLNTACVGALEVDERGNVNVSRRGHRVQDFVGTGGFPNLVHLAANTVVVFSWKAGRRGRTGVEADPAAKRVKVTPGTGKVKLVKQVDHVTLCGASAVKAGKRVTYCTNVGVFELRAGPRLELTHVFHGVDPKRDIVDASGVDVSISPNLQIIGADVISGEGFELSAP